MISVLLVLNEICVIFWERKDEGLIACLKLPLRFAKYLLCTIVVFIAFGHGAFLLLLLLTWFHRIDDVIDGDAPLPKGWTNKEYQDQKRALICALANGRTDAKVLHEDLLLVRAFGVACLFGTTVTEEINDIWTVIEWECERRENKRLVTRLELVEQTAKQDRAVLRVCVKTTGGNVALFDTIAQTFTGIFTRADWLDDTLIDLNQGIINIPIEGVSEYGIEIEKSVLARVGRNSSKTLLLLCGIAKRLGDQSESGKIYTASWVKTLEASSNRRWSRSSSLELR